jgi:hypothetical protein
MSTKTRKYKPGDIFNFEINKKEFGFGRVILDVYPQCVKTGLIDKHSLLLFGNEESIFIELFKQTSSNPLFEIDTNAVLVPGLFPSNFALVDYFWQVVGYEPVDFTKIDFPEFLTHDGATHGKFIKGEISITIEVPYEEVEAINIYANELAVISIPDVVLFGLGRFDEMESDQALSYFVDMSKNDIRFSDVKEKIHAKLPDIFKGAYYEVSKALGYDLKRFF